MTVFDPETGKLRPVWTIRFSPGVIFLGSLVGGAVTGLILAGNLLLGGDPPADLTDVSIGRASVLVIGIALVIFLLLGPVLGWGLGFALRSVQNQNIHVLAFAGLGLFVGYSVGEYLGRLYGVVGLGSVVAPAVGIGAAIGRWSISRYAKI